MRRHLSDEWLVRYANDEVGRVRGVLGRRHLARCTECRVRVAKLWETQELIARGRRAALSAGDAGGGDARARLMAGMAGARREAAASKSVVGLRARLALAATVVVAVVGASMLYRPGRSAPRPDLMVLALSTPDRSLTPGATRPVELAEICGEVDPDLDPPVSPTLRRAVMQEYGMDTGGSESGRRGEYQVDYLINPQLGGTASIQNLWPQPYGARVWNARAKDRLEDRLHQMVCARQIDLGEAQQEIATDWIGAYKRYLGSSPGR